MDFLPLPGVYEMFPKDWCMSSRNCYCSPKIAATSAKKPFHNRFVIIGDAACSRYYKNGIESAFMTAQLAAETAFTHGISNSAFKNGYFRQIKRKIIRDNFYGKILFKISDLVYDRVFLSQVLLKILTDEEGQDKPKYMRDILWNLYTGNIPYSKILVKFCNLILQWKLIFMTFKLGIAKVRSKLLSRAK